MAQVELKGRVGKDIHLTVLSVMDELTTVAAYWQKAKKRVSLKEYLESERSVLHIAFPASSKEAMGLIVNSMMSVMVNLALRMKNEGPNDATFLFADEMADLADLSGIDLIARQGRKAGLSCFSAALTKEALTAHWGQARTEEFLSLTTAKFCLNSSLDTAKWFTEPLSFEGWQESRSESESTGTTDTQSWGAGPGGRNWQDSTAWNSGKTFGKNFEMKQRQAVLVSEIAGLPIPDLARGFDEISGFGFSGTTGVYKFIVEGAVRAVANANKGQKFVMPKRPASDAKLLPWTEEDLKRLKIPRTPKMMAAINGLK